MNRRSLLLAATAMPWLEAFAADAYPARPVTLVAPFPAGGSVDVIARLVAVNLGEQLKQPFVVDNRLGASGLIGATYVAKAAPDGYTLLLSSTSTHSLAAATKATMPYDVERSFAPVVEIANSKGVLLVPATLGANTMSELTALLRSRGGNNNYGSAGVGTVGHLNVEAILSVIGAKATHVPYKGTSLAMQDLMGGQLTMLWDSITSAMPAIRSGRVRAVAVAGRSRSKLLPEVPTLTEAGVPGLPLEAYFGLWAPAGTPAAIVETLNKSVNALLATPRFAAELEKLAAEPAGGTPATFTRRIANDAQAWKKIIKDSGIDVGS